VKRLEAALGSALPDHLERGDRRVEALEMLGPEAGDLEHAADQTIGELRDDDSARLGDRLESGSEIGGLADHGILLG